MSNFDGIHSHLHVALLPSSGMGHLIPFLRLAASLIHQQCQVTLITTDSIVSFAESQLISRFLSAFPQVTEKKIGRLPKEPIPMLKRHQTIHTFGLHTSLQSTRCIPLLYRPLPTKTLYLTYQLNQSLL